MFADGCQLAIIYSATIKHKNKTGGFFHLFDRWIGSNVTNGTNECGHAKPLEIITNKPINS